MSKRISTAAAAINRISLDSFLERLGQRDRVNIERHLATCEAESDPRHAAVWRRLVQTLGTLAPLAASTTGQTAIAFFVPDGKYRMQVFAIEDNRDGKVLIYVPDVISDSISAGILSAPARGAAPDAYKITADADQILSVESLDATNTPNPATFFKHMLGWNRKALRVTLPVDASDEQLDAAEGLCAIAAKRWAAKVAS